MKYIILICVFGLIQCKNKNPELSAPEAAIVKISLGFGLSTNDPSIKEQNILMVREDISHNDLLKKLDYDFKNILKLLGGNGNEERSFALRVTSQKGKSFYLIKFRPDGNTYDHKKYLFKDNDRLSLEPMFL